MSNKAIKKQNKSEGKEKISVIYSKIYKDINGLHLIDQLKECKKFLDNKEIYLFLDHDKFEEEQSYYVLLLKLIQKGVVEQIVLYEYKNLSNDPEIINSFLQICVANNVKVIILKDTVEISTKKYAVKSNSDKKTAIYSNIAYAGDGNGLIDELVEISNLINGKYVELFIDYDFDYSRTIQQALLANEVEESKVDEVFIYAPRVLAPYADSIDVFFDICNECGTKIVIASEIIKKIKKQKKDSENATL